MEGPKRGELSEVQLVKKLKLKDGLAESFSVGMGQPVDCTSCEPMKRKILFWDIVEGSSEKDVCMGDLTDDLIKIFDDESVNEEDEKDDPAYPTIRVSKQDKLQIHESWFHTPTLKVLG